jgi:hypothetical protein
VLCLNGTNILHRGDSLEDDEHTGRRSTVRTELKIEEVGMVVRANRSKTVDEVTATAGISHGIRPEHVLCHPAQCSTRPDARAT